LNAIKEKQYLLRISERLEYVHPTMVLSKLTYHVTWKTQ